MKRSAIFACIFFFGASGYAQHEHHGHPDYGPAPKQQDSTAHEAGFSEMPHAFSRNLPMTRNASGTGWLPDATVMYGHGIHTGKWMYMFHANLFLRYNRQDIFNSGSRGGEKFDAPNWLMFMGQRNVGRRGLFHFGLMLSADPFTVGGKGYPLLFQSGETYKGKRLVDRQHPHDLFSGLSLAYTHMFSRDMDLTAYLGYPSEPALGPVAFMHRPSALNNPDAPLGHHWQDATHISFGVATLGLRYKMLKVEASSFTGREPDEVRTDFDTPRFDSWSMRVLYNPNRNLALQISQALLRSPEAAELGVDVHRITASIIHQLPLDLENKYLASTFSWGLNSSDHMEHSVLLESNLQLDKTAVYGRYEWLQKGAEELDLQQFAHNDIFMIQALTLGANRVIFRKTGNNIAAGVQATLYVSDNRLSTLYGSHPVGAEVYLRLYPHIMHMHHHNK